MPPKKLVDFEEMTKNNKKKYPKRDIETSSEEQTNIKMKNSKKDSDSSSEEQKNNKKINSKKDIETSSEEQKNNKNKKSKKNIETSSEEQKNNKKKKSKKNIESSSEEQKNNKKKKSKKNIESSSEEQEIIEERLKYFEKQKDILDKKILKNKETLEIENDQTKLLIILENIKKMKKNEFNINEYLNDRISFNVYLIEFRSDYGSYDKFVVQCDKLKDIYDYLTINYFLYMKCNNEKIMLYDVITFFGFIDELLNEYFTNYSHTEIDKFEENYEIIYNLLKNNIIEENDYFNEFKTTNFKIKEIDFIRI